MMKVAEVSGLLRWPHFRGPDLEGITLYPLPTDLSHDVCQRYHTLNAGSQTQQEKELIIKFTQICGYCLLGNNTLISQHILGM